jgi:hypothetical protein
MKKHRVKWIDAKGIDISTPEYYTPESKVSKTE